MSIYEKLQKIQMELDVPKSQFNSFGKYHYRSCEDILAAVKPVAAKYNCVVKVFDEMVEVGGRCYVKVTARLVDCEELTAEEATGYAREEETKKGMDAAQITGAASSYARKYALNGLFCLDDVKDADALNKHGKETHGSDDLSHVTDEDIAAEFADAVKEKDAVNICDDCGALMTPSQVTLSTSKYDKPLCPKCQKEVA